MRSAKSFIAIGLGLAFILLAGVYVFRDITIVTVHNQSTKDMTNMRGALALSRTDFLYDRAWFPSVIPAGATKHGFLIPRQKGVGEILYNMEGRHQTISLGFIGPGSSSDVEITANEDLSMIMKLHPRSVPSTGGFKQE